MGLANKGQTSETLRDETKKYDYNNTDSSQQTFLNLGSTTQTKYKVGGRREGEHHNERGCRTKKDSMPRVLTC